MLKTPKETQLSSTRLTMGIWYFYEDAIRFLEANHADLNVLNPGDQNLLHAAIVGDRIACMVYLAQILDINLRNQNGCSSLITAAKYE